MARSKLPWRVTCGSLARHRDGLLHTRNLCRLLCVEFSVFCVERPSQSPHGSKTHNFVRACASVRAWRRYRSCDCSIIHTSTGPQEPQVAALRDILAVEGEWVQLGGFLNCFLAPVDVGHRCGGRRSGGRHVSRRCSTRRRPRVVSRHETRPNICSRFVSRDEMSMRVCCPRRQLESQLRHGAPSRDAFQNHSHDHLEFGVRRKLNTRCIVSRACPEQPNSGN